MSRFLVNLFLNFNLACRISPIVSSLNLSLFFSRLTSRHKNAMFVWIHCALFPLQYMSETWVFFADNKCKFLFEFKPRLMIFTTWIIATKMMILKWQRKSTLLVVCVHVCVRVCPCVFCPCRCVVISPALYVIKTETKTSCDLSQPELYNIYIYILT